MLSLTSQALRGNDHLSAEEQQLTRGGHRFDPFLVRVFQAFQPVAAITQ